MTIGAGIFLAAVGAILTFAVTSHVNGINIQVVGIILMVAGVLGVILDLAVFMPRRRATTVTTATAPNQVTRETRY